MRSDVECDCPKEVEKCVKVPKERCLLKDKRKSGPFKRQIAMALCQGDDCTFTKELQSVIHDDVQDNLDHEERLFRAMEKLKQLEERQREQEKAQLGTDPVFEESLQGRELDFISDKPMLVIEPLLSDPLPGQAPFPSAQFSPKALPTQQSEASPPFADEISRSRPLSQPNGQEGLRPGLPLPVDLFPNGLPPPIAEGDSSPNQFSQDGRDITSPIGTSNAPAPINFPILPLSPSQQRIPFQPQNVSPALDESQPPLLPGLLSPREPTPSQFQEGQAHPTQNVPLTPNAEIDNKQANVISEQGKQTGVPTKPRFSTRPRQNKMLQLQEQFLFDERTQELIRMPHPLDLDPIGPIEPFLPEIPLPSNDARSSETLRRSRPQTLPPEQPRSSVNRNNMERHEQSDVPTHQMGGDKGVLHGFGQEHVISASGSDHQGIPPQGIPHQGIPPQGIPPQGIPPQGIPPQGIPPQGIPLEGILHQGIPLEGIPPQGIPPQGIPPQGIPPQGIPPQGIPPQDIPPQGIPLEGIPHQGIPLEGIPPQELPSHATNPQIANSPRGPKINPGFQEAQHFDHDMPGDSLLSGHEHTDHLESLPPFQPNKASDHFQTVQHPIHLGSVIEHQQTTPHPLKASQKEAEQKFLGFNEDHSPEFVEELPRSTVNGPIHGQANEVDENECHEDCQEIKEEICKSDVEIICEMHDDIVRETIMKDKCELHFDETCSVVSCPKFIEKCEFAMETVCDDNDVPLADESNCVTPPPECKLVKETLCDGFVPVRGIHLEQRSVPLIVSIINIDLCSLFCRPCLTIAEVLSIKLHL
jgi:hypothetical protein